MIDLSAVTYEHLTREHPDRVKWSWKWPDLRLLYRGGEELLLAAGQRGVTRAARDATSTGAAYADPMGANKRRRRFLQQLEGEPDSVYYSRWERADYIGYLTAIVDYFRHFLYSAPPVIRPKDGGGMPDWWEPFFKNATGDGKNLFDLGRDSFLDLLMVRRCGWLVGRALGVAQEEDDDEAVIVTPYKAEEILDWQLSDCGQLEWVV